MLIDENVVRIKPSTSGIYFDSSKDAVKCYK